MIGIVVKCVTCLLRHVCNVTISMTTYNSFSQDPSEELYKLNHRVHTGGIICTTAAVVIFIKGILRGK